MRGFDDARRARIREELIDVGRESFARYGLKKTTIADLTDPVGIATSTFYRFFDSKEALYLEILEREGTAITKRIDDALEATDGPEEAIRRLLSLVIEEIETNPFIEKVIVEDELDELRQYRSSDERDVDRDEDDLAYFLPYVDRWHETGGVRDADPRAIANTLRAATMITLHEEDIGEELYPETRDLLIEALAAGLTTQDE